MFLRLERNPLVHLVITMWRYAEGYRLAVLAYICMALVAIAIHLCEPLLVARLMQTLQELEGQELLAESSLYLAMFFLLSLGFWCFHGPSRTMENSVAFWVRERFLTVLFRKVTNLPIRWHKDTHSGETIDQINKAVTALGEFSEGGFLVVHMLTRLLGAVSILAFFMPLAALAVSVATLVVIVVVVLFDKVLVSQYNTLNRRFNQLAAKVQDFLTNVGTVISLRLERHSFSEVRDYNRQIFPLARKNIRTSELKWFCTAMLIRIMQTGVIFGYLFGTVRGAGQIEIATFYALFEYLRTIGDTFFEFTWQYGELVKKSARVRAIEQIDQAYSELVKPLPELALPSGWRRIDIRNLCFSHDCGDGKNGRLFGISFNLRRGKMIALVGPSGCGKSTTLALLRALYPADRATVLLDGQPLLGGLGGLANSCTLIPQEPEIFAGTIRFNITLGRNADDPLLEEVLDLARFSVVLKKLPKGLETNIAEKGVNLSGGEKQRLALARGLFFAKVSNSELVLLDEPTSSVDPVNERLIYSQIRRHFADRCVVSALHKLNLLDLFDHVLVFDSGRVVESGRPEQLKAANGALAQILRKTDAEKSRPELKVV